MIRRIAIQRKERRTNIKSPYKNSCRGCFTETFQTSSVKGWVGFRSWSKHMWTSLKGQFQARFSEHFSESCRKKGRYHDGLNSFFGSFPDSLQSFIMKHDNEQRRSLQRRFLPPQLKQTVSEALSFLATRLETQSLLCCLFLLLNTRSEYFKNIRCWTSRTSSTIPFC